MGYNYMNYLHDHDTQSRAKYLRGEAEVRKSTRCYCYIAIALSELTVQVRANEPNYHPITSNFGCLPFQTTTANLSLNLQMNRNGMLLK